MDSDDIFIGLKRRDETALSVLFDTYYEKLYLFAEKYIMIRIKRMTSCRMFF